MNLPNKLTTARIILIPFILLFLLPIPGYKEWNQWLSGGEARVIATLLFVIASFTDFLDGKIARSQNLVTNFGKLFDPIADKLLVLGSFAAFVKLGTFPCSVFVLIMAREFFVSGLRQVAAANGQVIAASPLGKWKTFSQLLCLFVLFIEPFLRSSTMIFEKSNIFRTAWIVLALIMTLISGIDYFVKNKDLVLSDC